MESGMLAQVIIYVSITSVLFQLIYNAHPHAFIDEIFHIPQTKKYCAGIFDEWDPKITTLPGMYIASLLALTPFTPMKGSSACTTWGLRYLNVLYNACTMYLAYHILKKAHTDIQNKRKLNTSEDQEKLDKHCRMASLVIGFFPVLYFFSFLYYTEPSSTLIVLAAYLASLNEHHSVAAALGLASIVFRQTNVIWLVFMAGTVVAYHLDSISEIEKIEASPELKDKLASFFAKLTAALLRYLLVLDNLRKVFVLIWPYIIVVGLFGLFVVVNGGIVVGDHSSHEAVFHLSQLLYFSGFTLFFASPVLVSVNKVKRFVHSLKKNPAAFAISILACIYVLINYTYKHPYLLADNRHYTFYLWRWLLGRRFLRILLIPFYVYASWSMNDSLSLNTRCTVLWKAVFVVCVAAVCAPQKLLEPRYFIMPYIIFRLHVGMQKPRVVLLEILLHVLVNIATIVVFLNKTFMWPDLDEPQRIIW